MTPTLAVREQHTSRIGATVLQLLIAAVLPVLLVLLNARLVMSPAFLHFEYTRPDFPEDYFGLAMEERLQYAPYAINYLLNGDNITYLGDLRFPDGTSLFNDRELRHMRDVKLMTQITFGGALVAGILAVTAGYALLRSGRLARALMYGSLLTLGLIAAVVIVAIFSWETFFTSFHALFFADGTWYFAYSDTLIRLFPEQFWFDAALLVGGLTTLEAGLILLVIWYRNRAA